MSEVALFIDLENITQSLWKRFQLNADPFLWVEKARKYGPISFARAYGDFAQPHLQRLESDLRAAGIDRFDCPVKVREESSQSTVDTNVVIDLFEIALDRPGIKTFVVMAGDSDYVRVVARLRHRLEKDVVIAAVPGSLSRELARAATAVDLFEPAARGEVDEKALIQLIDRFETSLPEGIYPTFGRLHNYVSDIRNAGIVDPQVAQQYLNDMVRRGLLVQERMDLPDGREIRVTRLDLDAPEVAEALDLQDDAEVDAEAG